MAFIDSSAVRPKFTSDLVAAYKSSLTATTFLQNKFKRVTKETDYLEINVQRFAQLIAKDVVRGGDGNRNSFSKMVQKVEQPPFFYEYLDVMQLEGYNRAFGSVSMSASAYKDFRATAIFNVQQIVNKIDRAYELQAAQVLLTGVVTTQVAGNTDFLRKATSKVPYTLARDWSVATTNPKDDLQAGCLFNIQVGKAASSVFDAIMGDRVYNAFINNPIIQNQAQKLWNILTKIEEPEARGDGSAFMGQVSAGPYKVNIYTYPQFYATSADITINDTPYIPTNALIIIPTNPDFIHGFAMVPKLPDYMGIKESGMMGAISGTSGTGKGQYFMSEFVDMKATAWYMAAKSAGLCWPVAVDQIWTTYPLAV